MEPLRSTSLEQKKGSPVFGVKEPSHHTCAYGTPVPAVLAQAVQAKDTTDTQEKAYSEPLFYTFLPFVSVVVKRIPLKTVEPKEKSPKSVNMKFAALFSPPVLKYPVDSHFNQKGVFYGHHRNSHL